MKSASTYMKWTIKVLWFTKTKRKSKFKTTVTSNFAITFIFKASLDGRTVVNNDVERLDLSKDAKAKIVNGMTLEEFKTRYGSHVIIGAEYGGNIMLNRSKWTSSKQVSGNRGGTGSWSRGRTTESTSFVGVATSATKDVAEMKTQLSRIDPLQPISDQISTVNKMARAARDALLRFDVDRARPNEAVLCPIEAIPCVSAAFIKQMYAEKKMAELIEMQGPLVAYLNELYITFVSIKADWERMEDPEVEFEYEKDNEYLRIKKVVSNYKYGIEKHLKTLAAQDWPVKELVRIQTARIEFLRSQHGKGKMPGATLELNHRKWYLMDADSLQSDWQKQVLTPFNSVIARFGL